VGAKCRQPPDRVASLKPINQTESGFNQTGNSFGAFSDTMVSSESNRGRGGGGGDIEFSVSPSPDSLVGVRVSSMDDRRQGTPDAFLQSTIKSEKRPCSRFNSQSPVGSTGASGGHNAVTTNHLITRPQQQVSRVVVRQPPDIWDMSKYQQQQQFKGIRLSTV